MEKFGVYTAQAWKKRRSQVEPEHWARGGDCILTIGNFDGVHLGHRSLLAKVRQESTKLAKPGVLLTFDPHPLQVLRPDFHFQRLFDLDDQAEQIRDQGLTAVVRQNFDAAFAKASPHEFLDNFVEPHFKPKMIVVGEDFRFGQGRQGDRSVLEAWARARQIECCFRPKLSLQAPGASGPAVVSSSNIRKALAQGDPKSAAAMLGRAYELRGPVVSGLQRGRQIGFPTANIIPSVDFLPQKGVYVSESSWGGRRFRSVTNIGVNPTVSASPLPKIETHIFGLSEDLYGITLTVSLLDFLRPERKFSGLEELRQAIAADCELAQKWGL